MINRGKLGVIAGYTCAQQIADGAARLNESTDSLYANAGGHSKGRTSTPESRARRVTEERYRVVRLMRIEDLRSTTGSTEANQPVPGADDTPVACTAFWLVIAVAVAICVRNSGWIALPGDGVPGVRRASNRQLAPSA